jgi:hypothetical protein
MSRFKAGAKRWRELALSQFIEARPLLLFVTCLMTGGVYAELARKFCGSDWMDSCGMAIEIIGICFVTLEIVSARKRVGIPGFRRASFNWLARNRYFFVRPKPVEGGLSGRTSISFRHRGARLSDGSKGTKLSDRVETLEGNLKQILGELDQVSKRFDIVEKSITTMLNEKTQVLMYELERQKSLIAEISAGDSAFKLVGVLLVLLGFVVQNLPSSWAPSPLL